MLYYTIFESLAKEKPLKTAFKVLAGLAILAVVYPTAADQRPVVAASVRPLTLMVEDLAGEWLEVRTLLAPDQKPHHLSLSPSQRQLLEEAALVVWVGPGLESFLEKPMAAMEDGRGLSLEALAVESGLPGHGEPGYDPHLWMRPPLVKTFYQRLARELMSRYPQRAEQIVTRVAQINADIDSHLSALSRRLSTLQDRAYMVEHRAYGHFSEYFGLTPAGALVDTSGVTAGPRSFAKLATEQDVRCLVVEHWPASQRARRLAALLKVRMIAIDPLGQDVAGGRGGYTRYLDSLGEGFESCLTAEPLVDEQSDNESGAEQDE